MERQCCPAARLAIALFIRSPKGISLGRSDTLNITEGSLFVLIQAGEDVGEDCLTRPWIVFTTPPFRRRVGSAQLTQDVPRKRVDAGPEADHRCTTNHPPKALP